MEALSSYSVKLSDFKNDSEAKEKFGKQHTIQETAASAGSGSQKISSKKKSISRLQQLIITAQRLVPLTEKQTFHFVNLDLINCVL